MEIPVGFKRVYDNKSRVLKLKHSAYELKQSNYNFCKKLSTALEARSIKTCSTDSCIYVSKQLILIAYVDNVLIFSKEKLQIDLLIKSLFEGDENFELTNEDNIDKYLEVDIKENKDGTYEIR